MAANPLKNAVDSRQSSYSQRYAYGRPVASSVSSFPQPPTRAVQRQRNTQTFSVGDRVSSPDYGVGEIVSAETKGGRTIVRVSYENGRKAIYNTEFCNLKKL